MFLSPIISLNKSFIMSNIYRKKVILIQRAWKSKYNNRVYALLYFIDHHVEKMIKEYPYLKIFAEDFYNKRANREICLGYIKDESLKYRFIYDAYQRKLEEIDEIIEVNSKI
jgi:nuclear transport factor 2 (NTF2) superfamily protein